jgi:hypothetical protein
MTPGFVNKTALLFSLLLTLCGCTTYIPPPSIYTPLQIPEERVEEALLLDVAISLFDNTPQTGQANSLDPALDDVRRVESRYMPVMLRNTLEKADSWGELYVLPEPADNHDVLVEGSIVESSPHTLKLQVRATDATGRLWFDRLYTEHVGNNTYMVSGTPVVDPFQSLYNRVANDMLAYTRSNLDATSITRIRQVAQVKFGNEYAPELYGHYLRTGRNGRSEIVGLPPENDPVQLHLANIRKRDRMFQTVLQQNYQDFSRRVHENYFNFRQSSYVELNFLREQQAASRNQILTGLLLLGTAYVLVETDSNRVDQGSINAAAVAAAVYGVGQIYQGANSYPDKSEFMQGLSESFVRDAGPKVIELDEKVIILSGSVEEVFQQWKVLLREMFEEDRGLDLNTES